MSHFLKKTVMSRRNALQPSCTTSHTPQAKVNLSTAQDDIVRTPSRREPRGAYQEVVTHVCILHAQLLPCIDDLVQSAGVACDARKQLDHVMQS